MPNLLGFYNVPSFQQVFEKNSIQQNGEKVLTKTQFMEALKSDVLFPVKEKHLDMLFIACDTTKSGYINLAEFLEFENILKQPDASFQILSRFISGQAKGVVSKEQIKNIFSDGLIDFDTPLLKNAVGLSNQFDFNSLSQLTVIIKKERLRRFFASHDQKSAGVISTCCVVDFLQHWGGYRQNSDVLKNIKAFGKITFVEFSALFSVLDKLDHIKTVAGSMFHNADILSRQEFYKALAGPLKYTQITPLEIDLLCRITGNNDQISLSSLVPLFYPSIPSVEVFQPVKLSAGMEMLKSIYNFSLGSIAGAIGAFAVYPIGTD
jgi:solute carrier family 25 (mitochondrial aspartate/glutamate transporter), member 12/13